MDRRAPLPEDPAFDRVHCFVLGGTVNPKPEDDREHAEQTDNSIELVLAGVGCTKPVGNDAFNRSQVCVHLQRAAS